MNKEQPKKQRNNSPTELLSFSDMKHSLPELPKPTVKPESPKLKPRDLTIELPKPVLYRRSKDRQLTEADIRAIQTLREGPLDEIVQATQKGTKP